MYINEVYELCIQVLVVLEELRLGLCADGTELSYFKPVYAQRNKFTL